jgi:hypothetical protein
VFGPIVGVVLDGYSFNPNQRVAWIVAIVMPALLLEPVPAEPRGLKILEGFEAPAPACMYCRPTTNRACAGSSRC